MTGAVGVYRCLHTFGLARNNGAVSFDIHPKLVASSAGQLPQLECIGIARSGVSFCGNGYGKQSIKGERQISIVGAFGALIAVLDRESVIIIARIDALFAYIYREERAVGRCIKTKIRIVGAWAGAGGHGYGRRASCGQPIGEVDM